jgi:hypothetical protein
VLSVVDTYSPFAVVVPPPWGVSSAVCPVVPAPRGRGASVSARIARIARVRRGRKAFMVNLKITSRWMAKIHRRP